MTKRDLVVEIAKDTELTQNTVYSIIQKTLDQITTSLADGKHIELRDFGVFEVATRKTRIGRNPNKPDDVVQIPERKVVKFKPGKRMKTLVIQS